MKFGQMSCTVALAIGILASTSLRADPLPDDLGNAATVIVDDSPAMALSAAPSDDEVPATRNPDRKAKLDWIAEFPTSSEHERQVDPLAQTGPEQPADGSPRFFSPNLKFYSDATHDFRVTPWSNIQWGSQVNVKFSVANTGDRDVNTTFFVRVYLSTNDYISTLDVPWYDIQRASLESGQFFEGNYNWTLPASPPTDFPQGGTVYIGMFVDYDNRVAEDNEDDNRNQGQFKDFDYVTFAAQTAGFGGRVTNCDSGAGIAGATVQWGTASVTTDASGNYAFSQVGCGTNSLTITRSGFAAYSQSYTPLCNSSNVKNACLAPFSASLGGRITSCANGAGIPNASVQWGSRSTTTNASGYYQMSNLPCETNNLVVSISGYQSFSQTFTPTCNASNTRDICLNQQGGPQPTSFSGRVTNCASTAGLAGVTVRWGTLSSVTSASGGFQFNDVPCQTQSLSANETGYVAYQQSYTPTCGTASTVNFCLQQDVPTTSLSGVVTDCLANTPIVGAAVTWGTEATTTDGNGSYRFNNVRCDTDLFTINKDGYRPNSESFSLNCSSPTTKNLCLEPVLPNELELQVSPDARTITWPGQPVVFTCKVMANGQAVQGARIPVDDQADGHHPTLTTDASGTVHYTSQNPRQSADVCFGPATKSGFDASAEICRRISVIGSFEHTMRFGLLTITADTVYRPRTDENNVWRFEGNVRINEKIRASGAVQANSSTLRVSGSGSLFLEGPFPPPIHGDIRLYNGSWSFDGQTAATGAINRALSGLKVVGLDMEVSQIGLDGDAVVVQGMVRLPPTLGGLRVDIEGDHYVAASRARGVEYDIAILGFQGDLPVKGLLFKADDVGVSFNNIDDDDVMKFHGRFKLPLFRGVRVDLDHDSGKYILLRNDGSVEVNGRVDINGRVTMAPNLYLDDLWFSLNTGTDRYTGHATMGLPIGTNGLEVGVTVTIRQGYLDAANIRISDLNRPIFWTPTPPPVPIVFLESISAGVAGLRPEDNRHIRIQLGGSFTLGPEVEINNEDWSLIYLDLEGELDLGGRVTGNADMKIGKQNSPIFEGSARAIFDRQRGFYMGVSFQKEWDGRRFLEFTGDAAVDWNNNFQAGLDGTIKIPSGIPVLSAMFGNRQLALEAYGQYTRNSLTSDDYVIGGWRHNITFWHGGQIQLRHAVEVSLRNGAINWNADWSRIREVDFPGGLRGGSTPPEPMDIAAGTPLAILRASWQTGMTDVYLVDPSGNLITPDTVSNFPNVVYYENPEVPEGFYVIDRPAAGQWQMTLADGSSIGAYNFQHLQPTTPPTINVLTPSQDTSATPVQITWSAADADSDATISLFYDADGQGANGQMIVEGLREGVDTSYNWTPSGVQPGTYNIYAVIQDGPNVPVVRYAAGRVSVTNPNAPAAPTGLAAAAEPITGDVRFTWNGSNAADIAGYTLYYSADPSGNVYELSAGTTGTDSELIIEGLTPGQTYRCAVAAFDTDNNLSAYGNPILVTVRDSANNHPVFTGAIADRAIVGQPYQSLTSASDLDGDSLLFFLSNQPAGMTIGSDNGLISWTPAADQAGAHEFSVWVSDRAGGLGELHTTVNVLEPDVDNVPPQILSRPQPFAEPNTTYGYVIRATDPNPGNVLTYGLVRGPAGAQVNAAGLLTYNVPAGDARYEFTVSVQDAGGMSDQQHFTIYADHTSPALNSSDWGLVTAASPTSILVVANPAADVTGLIEYQLLADGQLDSWQRTPYWTKSGLLPNTRHAYRIRTRDATSSQNSSTYSTTVFRYTLATVPPAPTLQQADTTALRLGISGGDNPATTELALWNVTDATWVGLNGKAAESIVWASAANWNGIRIDGLQVDTLYLFQVKARNGESVETELSDPLDAFTSAPMSTVGVTASSTTVVENTVGSTAQRIALSVAFRNDPFAGQNTTYTYSWNPLVHPTTGKALQVMIGGTPNDYLAVFASPEMPAGHATPYEVEVMITGNTIGNYVMTRIPVSVIRRGDVNLDGATNGRDIATFLRVLFNQDSDPQHRAAADVDGNGSVNSTDANILLSGLLTP